MPDPLHFFLLWAASSAGSVMLIAIAGYLGRSQLSHWLTRDLERVKAQHQRELESYKVGLISQAESAKSNVELRRAAALKIIEKKFLALDGFHKMSAGMAADFLEFAGRKSEEKGKAESDELAIRYQQFRLAAIELEIFLDEEQVDILTQYRGAFVPIMAACGPKAPSMPAEEHERAEAELFARKRAMDRLIRNLAAEMQHIG